MLIQLKLKNDEKAAEVFNQLCSQAGIYTTRQTEYGDIYIGENMNIETDFTKEGMVTYKILVKPQIDG